MPGGHGQRAELYPGTLANPWSRWLLMGADGLIDSLKQLPERMGLIRRARS